MLIPFLTESNRRENMILVDLAITPEEDETLRFNLNVVFNAIAVRRGVINRYDYYVATTGAEIVIEADQGNIRDYTEQASLTIEYTTLAKASKAINRNFKPALKLKAAGVEGEAQLIEVGRQKEISSEFTAKFVSSESLLSTTFLNDTTKWTLTTHRADKVIRDFLIGNLFLFASCSWTEGQRAGRIRVKPEDVRFYDSEKRRLSAIRSLVMLFILWRKGISVQNADGYLVYFYEEMK
jgi:hypothetical protein